MGIPRSTPDPLRRHSPAMPDPRSRPLRSGARHRQKRTDCVSAQFLRKHPYPGARSGSRRRRPPRTHSNGCRPPHYLRPAEFSRDFQLARLRPLRSDRFLGSDRTPLGAPEFVFAALSSLLADQGILICTTPNAADISKRLKLTLGRNPYERLRLYSTNPGHIREYTRQELCEIADSVGLRCTSHAYRNWIEDRSGHPVKTAIMKLLRGYPPFRSFQACVFARKRTLK